MGRIVKVIFCLDGTPSCNVWYDIVAEDVHFYVTLPDREAVAYVIFDRDSLMPVLSVDTANATPEQALAHAHRLIIEPQKNGIRLCYSDEGLDLGRYAIFALL